MQLTKQSVDLGIVSNDAPAAVAFYRDVLGFDDLGGNQMPWGKLHRLVCGTSHIKIVSLAEPAVATAPPGGVPGATGYRYWTISVDNLTEVVEACRAAGRPVPVEVTEVRPGVRIAMVEDPDGNWVEFLGTT